MTARSCSFPERELDEAKRFTSENGITHFICDSEELDIVGFSDNPPNRCYLCKKELFSKIREIADKHGIKYIAEGSNLDDDGDYRPGHTAVAELGIKSPLRHVGLTKSEIRQLSRDMGLSTWNKQSFACLSSRFVYGEKISKEGLRRVEMSEQLLLDMGFHQVRVRTHGNLARIEVSPEDIPRFLDQSNAEKVNIRLKEYGFTFVSLDLAGYRTGSMNDTLASLDK